MTQNVAILGASENPERYAFKAFKMLQEYNHHVFPVNPHLQKLEETPVVSQLTDLKNKQIDTLTLYVGPQRLAPLIDQIIELKPKRVIFNPGTESPEMEKRIQDAGIEILEACTLVLLRTNQF